MKRRQSSSRNNARTKRAKIDYSKYFPAKSQESYFWEVARYRKQLEIICENSSFSIETGNIIAQFSWPAQKKLKKSDRTQADILCSNGYSLEVQYDILKKAEERGCLIGLIPYYIAEGGFEIRTREGRRSVKTYGLESYPILHGRPEKWEKNFPKHSKFSETIPANDARFGFPMCQAPFQLRIPEYPFQAPFQLEKFIALVELFEESGHYILRTEGFKKAEDDYGTYYTKGQKRYHTKKSLAKIADDLTLKWENDRSNDKLKERINNLRIYTGKGKFLV